MRVALEIVCASAVLFLLRFLSALFREVIYLPRDQSAEYARNRKRQRSRENLIVMNAPTLHENRARTDSFESDDRIAL